MAGGCSAQGRAVAAVTGLAAALMALAAVAVLVLDYAYMARRPWWRTATEVLIGTVTRFGVWAPWVLIFPEAWQRNPRHSACRQWSTSWIACAGIVTVLFEPWLIGACVNGPCYLYSLTQADIDTYRGPWTAWLLAYTLLRVVSQLFIPWAITVMRLRMVRRRGSVLWAGKRGAAAASRPRGVAGAARTGGAAGAAGSGSATSAVLPGSDEGRHGRCACCIPRMRGAIVAFGVMYVVLNTLLLYGSGQQVLAVIPVLLLPVLGGAAWMDRRRPTAKVAEYVFLVPMWWISVFVARDLYTLTVIIADTLGPAARLVVFYAFTAMVAVANQLHEAVVVMATPSRQEALPMVLAFHLVAELFVTLLVVEMEPLSLSFFLLLAMECLTMFAIGTRPFRDAALSLLSCRWRWWLPPATRDRLPPPRAQRSQHMPPLGEHGSDHIPSPAAEERGQHRPPPAPEERGQHGPPPPADQRGNHHRPKASRRAARLTTQGRKQLSAFMDSTNFRLHNVAVRAFVSVVVCLSACTMAAVEVVSRAWLERHADLSAVAHVLRGVNNTSLLPADLAAVAFQRNCTTVWSAMNATQRAQVPSPFALSSPCAWQSGLFLATAASDDRWLYAVAYVCSAAAMAATAVLATRYLSGRIQHCRAQLAVHRPQAVQLTSTSTGGGGAAPVSVCNPMVQPHTTRRARRVVLAQSRSSSTRTRTSVLAVVWNATSSLSRLVHRYLAWTAFLSLWLLVAVVEQIMVARSQALQHFALDHLPPGDDDALVGAV